jgi:hypothetical protein
MVWEVNWSNRVNKPAATSSPQAKREIAEMLGAERIRRNVASRVACPWQAGLAPYRRASAYDFFVLEQTLKLVSSDAGLVAHASESVVER